MNETKKLYRIPSEGMIGGVCAGLAEYLGIDPTLVRLLFVFLALTGSAGIWVYLIMLVVVPVRPDIV
jgi:phage shock protein C